MFNNKIIVIDDEQIERVSIQAQLEKEGYPVESFATAVEALTTIRENPDKYATVLCDLRMPEMNGMEFISNAQKFCPDLMVIIMTAYGNIENAVNAMKNGAFDFITKPFSNDELSVKLERALSFRKNKIENIQLKKKLNNDITFEKIVCQSKIMKDIINRLKEVSTTDTNILIQSETGTGKSIIASAIHNNSNRKNHPFVKVSCAMLNKDLLESELFGHEAGSFTGAVKTRRGRFELADKGTLFLDEVDDISYDLQVKLLRAIEEGEFERVGGEKSIKTDVRIIAASKLDLLTQVKKKKFRDDLYYRLAVLTINIPSLKERKEDIEILIKFFIKKYYSKINNLPQKEIKNLENCIKIDPEAMEYFQNYNWPGNVREIENVIQHILAFNKTLHITVSDLPPTLVLPTTSNSKFNYLNSINFNETVDNVEKDIIKFSLAKFKGNQTKAAEFLNLPRTTLREKIVKFNLNL